MSDDPTLKDLIRQTIQVINGALVEEIEWLDRDIVNSATAALGDVTEELEAAIGKLESQFRASASRLFFLANRYRAWRTPETRADYIAQLAKMANWIAKVRDYGSRKRYRSVGRSRKRGQWRGRGR